MRCESKNTQFLLPWQQGPIGGRFKWH